MLLRTNAAQPGTIAFRYSRQISHRPLFSLALLCSSLFASLIFAGRGDIPVLVNGPSASQIQAGPVSGSQDVPLEGPSRFAGDVTNRDQLAQGEIPQPDNETWIDGPFELQYRVRVDEQAPPGVDFRSLPPLLYVDFRHTGNRDLSIDMHQFSNHSLVVNGMRYHRRDQPWGGATAVLREDGGLSLPFLLSPEWHLAEEGSTDRLEILPGGRYLVSVQLELLERFPGEARPGGPRGPEWRTLSTRTRIIEPVPLEVHDPLVLKELLRRHLVVFPRCSMPTVSESLRKLVVENQPAAGEYLLSRFGPGDDMSPDPASCVIANTWNTFTRDQLERYLFAAMSHQMPHRPEYPQGIKATIGVGPHFAPGYQGLPKQPNPKVAAKTMTTHFVDGQQVGKPYSYAGHSLRSFYFRTGELDLGKHTLSLVTEYEFLVAGEKYLGKVESPAVEIHIVPDTGDTLVDHVGPDLTQEVSQAFTFLETRQKSDRFNFGKVADWAPQMSYSNGGSLHCPEWQVAQPLPLDLCFDVEFQVENSDVRIPCNKVLVLKGESSTGYFSPSGNSLDVFRKNADADKFVKGRLVLTPSRELALSEPAVTRYFGATLTSGLLRFRVDWTEPIEKDGQLLGQW